jgi:hypothetical protein
MVDIHRLDREPPLAMLTLRLKPRQVRVALLPQPTPEYSLRAVRHTLTARTKRQIAVNVVITFSERLPTPQTGEQPELRDAPTAQPAPSPVYLVRR